MVTYLARRAASGQVHELCIGKLTDLIILALPSLQREAVTYWLDTDRAGQHIPEGRWLRLDEHYDIAAVRFPHRAVEVQGLVEQAAKEM